MCRLFVTLPLLFTCTFVVVLLFVVVITGKFTGDVYLLVKLLLPTAGKKRVYNLQSKQIVKILSQVCCKPSSSLYPPFSSVASLSPLSSLDSTLTLYITCCFVRFIFLFLHSFSPSVSCSLALLLHSCRYFIVIWMRWLKILRRFALMQPKSNF